MARIYENLADTFGNTPLVKIPRLNKGIRRNVLVKMESFNPAGSVKDRIGVAMIEAAERDGRLTSRHDDSRADQRKHRHRARVRRRRQGLSAHAGDARHDDDRAAQPAQGLRRSSRPDAGRRGHDGRDRARQRDSWQPLPTSTSCRSSSRIRPIRRFIAARRPRKSGAIPTARSTSFVAAVGTGGTITGVGEVLKERKPGVRSLPSSPMHRRCFRAESPDHTRSRARAPASFRRSSTSRATTKSFASPMPTRSPPHAASRAKKGCWSASRRARTYLPRCRSRTRPEFKGKTIVTVGCDTGERYLSNPVFAEQDAIVVEPALVS